RGSPRQFSRASHARLYSSGHLHRENVGLRKRATRGWQREANSPRNHLWMVSDEHEFERAMIRERVMARLARARHRARSSAGPACQRLSKRAYGWHSGGAAASSAPPAVWAFGVSTVQRVKAAL